MRARCEKQKPQKRENTEPINDFFLGNFEWAERTLKTLGDDQSVPTSFWTVSFTDRQSLRAFLIVWPNSRLLPDDSHGFEDNSKLGVWEVEDIVCFQFLREREGTVLAPCIEIEFASRKSRAAFLAHIDGDLDSKVA
jgi:hypothetical protein